jgi:hypothetical protein
MRVAVRVLLLSSRWKVDDAEGGEQATAAMALGGTCCAGGGMDVEEGYALALCSLRPFIAALGVRTCESNG